MHPGLHDSQLAVLPGANRGGGALPHPLLCWGLCWVQEEDSHRAALHLRHPCQLGLEPDAGQNRLRAPEQLRLWRPSSWVRPCSYGNRDSWDGGRQLDSCSYMRLQNWIKEQTTYMYPTSFTNSTCVLWARLFPLISCGMKSSAALVPQQPDVITPSVSVWRCLSWAGSRLESISGPSACHCAGKSVLMTMLVGKVMCRLWVFTCIFIMVLRENPTESDTLVLMMSGTQIHSLESPPQLFFLYCSASRAGEEDERPLTGWWCQHEGSFTDEFNEAHDNVYLSFTAGHSVSVWIHTVYLHWPKGKHMYITSICSSKLLWHHFLAQRTRREEVPKDELVIMWGRASSLPWLTALSPGLFNLYHPNTGRQFGSDSAPWRHHSTLLTMAARTSPDQWSTEARHVTQRAHEQAPDFLSLPFIVQVRAKKC